MSSKTKVTKKKVTKELVNKTLLLNGHYAPTEFYEQVQRHIQTVMPRVQPEILYTLKELCGNRFWSALPSNWWRVMAGRCFAHMVYKNKFPFNFVQYRRSPTKRYRLS